MTLRLDPSELKNDLKYVGSEQTTYWLLMQHLGIHSWFIQRKRNALLIVTVCHIPQHRTRTIRQCTAALAGKSIPDSFGQLARNARDRSKAIGSETRILCHFMMLTSLVVFNLTLHWIIGCFVKYFLQSEDWSWLGLRTEDSESSLSLKTKGVIPEGGGISSCKATKVCCMPNSQGYLYKLFLTDISQNCRWRHAASKDRSFVTVGHPLFHCVHVIHFEVVDQELQIRQGLGNGHPNANLAKAVGDHECNQTFQLQKKRLPSILQPMR